MNREFQEAFFKEHQARFSHETIRTYKIALSQFFSFCDKEVGEVKAKDIRVWLTLMNEKGLKPRSIHMKLSALKSFYQYCMEENLVIKNPAKSVRTPQKDDSLPYYLNKKKLVLLQELVKDNPRERAIVETLGKHRDGSSASYNQH